MEATVQTATEVPTLQPVSGERDSNSNHHKPLTHKPPTDLREVLGKKGFSHPLTNGRRNEPMPATAQTESTNKRRRNRDNGANASTTHTAAPPVERVMPPPIPRDPLPPMFQEPSRFEQITYGTIKAGAIVLGASLIVAGITSIARNAMGWNAYRKTGQFPDWMNKR